MEEEEIKELRNSWKEIKQMADRVKWKKFTADHKNKQTYKPQLIIQNSYCCPMQIIFLFCASE